MIQLPENLITDWMNVWLANVLRREIDREIMRSISGKFTLLGEDEDEDDHDCFLPPKIKEWLTTVNATYHLLHDISGYGICFDDPDVAAQFVVTWL